MERNALRLEPAGGKALLERGTRRRGRNIATTKRKESIDMRQVCERRERPRQRTSGKKEGKGGQRCDREK